MPPEPAPSAPSLLVAVAFGALQGATEFLPVSSSGHLAIASAVFGVDPAAYGHLLSVIVHGGTLLAVLVHYRRDLVRLARALWGAREGRTELTAVAAGTVPLLMALHPTVRKAVIVLEGDLRAVGIALLVTAAALLSTRLAPPLERPLSAGRALLVGLAQLCAVVPGVSRSGVTIAAGLWLGLSPNTAARFSFLLSIPAILGAVTLELRHAAASPLPPGAAATAFAVSFGVGLGCLRLLVLLAARGRLWLFVPYLAAVGTAALAAGAAA